MVTKSTRMISRRTITPGKVPAPSEVLEAEICINLTDRKMYTKDQNGDVFKLGGGGRGISDFLQYEDYGGYPALITDNRILVRKSSVGPNDYGVFHVQRDANFSGGTEGTVNGAIVSDVTVRAGVTSYEWGLQGILTNYSLTGQHCAAYSQINSEVDGLGWAHVFEHRDKTANPTQAKVTIEANINANGGDNNDNRRVIDVVLHKLNTGGANVIAGRAVSVGTGSGASFVSGYYINANAQKAVEVAGTHAVGLDTSKATISGNAVRLKANQTMALEETGAVTLSYNSANGRVELKNGNVVIQFWQT